MKIYLDNCSWQRPLDSKTQVWNWNTAGYGNYTTERDQLFADLTLDDLVSEIKRQRSQSQ